MSSTTCPLSLFLFMHVSAPIYYIAFKQTKLIKVYQKHPEKKKEKESLRKMQGMQKKEEANEKIATKKEEEGKGTEEENNNKPPPLMALNHVSRLCRNLKESIDFYTEVLGFVLIERPHAFDFDGAWLFNYGVGIHLLQAKDEDRLPDDPDHLDPNDNHISFQCENMEEMEQKLKDLNIKYKKRTVEDVENQTKIDQLFFNDPDGFMIEICNCENLKLVPIGSLGKIKLPVDRHNPPVEMENGDDTKQSLHLIRER